ncbi:MAG: hypothetical protein AAF636_27975 [Pseudomonadota bacterium]
MRGLAALDSDQYDSVALLCASGIGDDAYGLPVQKIIVKNCEGHLNRFAVLECARGLSNHMQIDPRRNIDSANAAVYFPWYEAPDPENGKPSLVPPGGGGLWGVCADGRFERCLEITSKHLDFERRWSGGRD